VASTSYAETVANMPRFNLRQLLLATTLVGIGLAMIAFGTNGINRAKDFVAVVLGLIVWLRE
jgi:hypothetical protein